jgi:hypothetical protein
VAPHRLNRVAAANDPLPGLDPQSTEGLDVTGLRARPRVTAAARIVVTAGVLAVGVVAVVAPSSASGAGSTGSSDTVTVNGQTSLTTRDTNPLTVRAAAQPTCTLGLSSRTVSLTLTGPAGADSTAKVLKMALTACNKEVDLSTSLSSPARNGAYQITLRNGRASRTTSDTLDVRIRPAQTQGFAVSASGTTATFRWTANPEPDVFAYIVTTTAGARVKAIKAAKACDGGSTCTTSTDLGGAAAGTTESFEVHAVRCGLTCDRHLSGPPSKARSASFTTPVRPSSPPVTEPPVTEPPTTSPPAVETVGPPASSPPGITTPTPVRTTHKPKPGDSPSPSSSISAPPPIGGSSAPAPRATPTHQVAVGGSSGGGTSGLDWLLRALAIVATLALLALHVRARAARSA